jgi:ribosomal-protein-alanine N-acetyltransferase
MFGRRRSADWPVELTGTTPAGTAIRLRPMRTVDIAEVAAVRRANADWLRPWDATSPVKGQARSHEEVARAQEDQALAGEAMPFLIDVRGRVVGQLHVTNIVRGAFWSCTAGYWVARSVAGQGVMPTAIALAGDHAFGTLSLHRIEVNIRPENAASLAVVRKLGFRDEGLRPRYLHIDGAWRDHRSFALTAEEVGPEGLMGRLLAGHRSHMSDTPPQVRNGP